LHAAALLLAADDLAANEMPVLAVLAMAFGVVTVTSAILLWRLSTSRGHAADLYFWSYGVAAFLLACGAGVAIALLALVAPPDAAPRVSRFAPPLLAALAMLDLHQALEATRANDRETQSRLMADDPARATLIILLLVSAIASIAATAALVLSQDFAVAAAPLVSGLVIVFALAVGATHLGLELRQRLAGAPAGHAMRRRLLVALDKAAMQSGAVRQIAGVETQFVGPAALRVILTIDFKDGVSAQHIAPVLEKLRKAAADEVPEVIDVVLAPPVARA
jgi:hypothetical protein